MHNRNLTTLRNTVAGAVPLVCNAIGQKAGVKVVYGAGGARTDGKTIYLPTLSMESPEAMAILAYGYALHEASHVRFTDMPIYRGYASKGPLAAAILNILEDVRIEKAICRPYPGAHYMLADLVEKLLNDGKFKAAEAQAQPQDVLVAWLLHGLRASRLGQRALEPLAKIDRRLLEARFRADTVAKLDALLARAFPLANTKEAGETMLAILELMKQDGRSQNAQDDQPSQDDQGGDEDQGSGQGQGGDAGEDHGQGESQGQGGQDRQEGEETQEDGRGQGQSGPGDSKGQGSNDGDGQSPRAGGKDDGGSAGQPGGQGADGSAGQPGGQGAGGLDATDAVTVPTDVGELVGQALNQEAEDDSGMPISSITEHAPGRGGLGGPAEEGEYVHPRYARQLAGPIGNRIRTLIEEEAMQRCKPAEEGARLMRNRLARVALGDKRVFTRRAITHAPDASIYLLVDRSGSMSSTRAHWTEAKHANTACLALAWALEPIKGVTLGVWGFGSSLWPIVVPGQKVGNGRSFNLSPKGGTCTAEAMAQVGGQLMAATTQRKMLIVITDGAPNNPTTTRSMANALSQDGIVVIGIGLGSAGTHAVKGLFHYGLGIESASHLGQQLAIVLREALRSNSRYAA